MRTRAPLVIAVSLVATVIVGIRLLHESEPVYKGQRLSLWLSRGREGFDDGTDAFLRENKEIVTRHLLACLRKRDNPLWKPYVAIRAKAPTGVSGYLPLWPQPSLVRAGATYWLAQLGHDAEAAVPELRRAARRDSSVEVRSQAIWALGRVDRGSRESTCLLADALGSDKDPLVRREAAGVLEMWTPKDPLVVQSFILGLHDSDAMVQQISAAALSSYGQLALAAVRPLQAVASSNGPASDFAARALKQITNAPP
ncbi:MAG TPA: HEAT repeat domain-containing protein [Verrucomicrobiae bacterium]|nr:HEAT repeat domain-containing protein [Verrucomicrobiae bacterium]